MGGIRMYEVERGSVEEAIMILQNLGLKVNEYEKTNSTIPVEKYKELLEFTIAIARKTNEVTDTIDEMMEDIETKL
jgi:predicted Fe-Mo cluster-binding NifX family protein